MRKKLILTSTAGGRVTLRVPDKTDLAFIRSLWADPATMAAVGGPVHMTEEQMARWHEQMVDPGRGTDLFTIIYDEKDLPIGEISFHRLDRDAMQADFNIKVRADRRGRGYGNEAMRLFLDYFFLKLGGERMTDDLALENVAGQRTLENFGFRHNPELKNAYRLELIREDYLNRQEN